MSDTQEQQSSAPKKRRRIWLWLVGLVLLLALLIGLAPTLLSTGPGNRLLLSQISGRIAGSVDAESIDLNWAGGQTLENFRLVDVDGAEVLRVNAIALPETGLFALVRDRSQIGAVRIEGVDATLAQVEDGGTNLDRAVASPDEKKPKPKKKDGNEKKEKKEDTPGGLPAGLSFSLVIDDLTATYVAPGVEKVTLALPDGRVDMRSPQEIALDLDATVTQSGSTGAITAKGTVRDLFDAEGKAQPTRASVEADATLERLPIEVVDRLTEQNGKLLELLGPILNATVKTTGTAEDLQVALAASSDHLNLNTTLQRRGESLSLVEQGEVSLTVTPAAWAAWMADKEGNLKATLAETTTATLTLNRLDVPMAEGGTDWSEVVAEVQITANDVVIDTDRDERITLQQFRGTLLQPQGGAQTESTDRPADVALTLRSDVLRSSNRQPAQKIGELRSETHVRDLYAEDKQINTAGLAIETETRFDGVPMTVIDGVLDMDGKATALIGEQADLAVVGNFPGDLDVSLKSERTRATLPVSIDAERQVALRDDVVIETMPTEETFKVLLGNVQPALADAVASEKPIRLEVDHEGFNLPMGDDADVRDLALTGRLDLGTLRMNRRGWINQGINGIVRRIFPRLGDRAPAEDTYLAEFTPMEFSVKDGKAQSTELWMTSPDLALGFQGSVDLENETIGMTMGMLGASLLTELRGEAEDFIDPARVYELPIKGDLSSPKIDAVAFAADIALVGAAREGLGDEADIFVDILKKTVLKPKESSGRQSYAWNPPVGAEQLVTVVTGGAPPPAEGEAGQDGEQGEWRKPTSAEEEEQRKEEWRRQHRERLRQQRESQQQNHSG